MRADRDDQLGVFSAAITSLTSRWSRAPGTISAASPIAMEPVVPGARAARILRKNDGFGAGAQDAVGGGVHVADDHVRREALVEDGVGAAVDADQRGLAVADVGAQGAQVLLVVDAADNDQRRPVAEARIEVGQVEVAGYGSRSLA